MKKILFVTTGGTIASSPTAEGLAPSLSGTELLACLPELSTLCEAHTLPLYAIDSTDMTPAHWLGLARAIEEHYDAYDGFVVCHGTDTLAYTAAALSYLIQDSAKPVVLTGAQKPISFSITDAKRNLRDSVVYALAPGSRGVAVVFDGLVIAGTRAKKEKTYSFDAFTSVNFPPLARVMDDRVLRYLDMPAPAGPPRFYRALDTRVFLLKLTPGLTPALLAPVVAESRCVIVESYGAGGIPAALAGELARRMAEPDKLLVLATQVPYEGSNASAYAVGGRLRGRCRFLEARDMTPEAVYAKLLWLLAQELPFAELERRFYAELWFDTLAGRGAS